MANTDPVSDKLKQIKIIFFGLALGQLVTGGAIAFAIYNGAFGEPDYSQALVLQQVAMFLVPGGMAAGYFIFKIQLKAIAKDLPLDQKLNRYLAAVVIRGALFELPFLFCCVAALITAELLFLYIAPVIFFVFLLLRPTVEGITADLDLTHAERSKLPVS